MVTILGAAIPAGALVSLGVTNSMVSTGRGSGGDENAPNIFEVDRGQLGKKLGKHTQDFGLDPSDAVDRAQISNLIADIGRNPERCVPGTFRGQGSGGSRGPVEFRIKGSDVVVTTPEGKFVTILKDGINNPSVVEAITNAEA